MMMGPGSVVAGLAPPQDNPPAVAFIRAANASPQATGDAKGVSGEAAPAKEGEDGDETAENPFIGNALAGYIWNSWSRNKRARNVIENRLLACLRARRGMYAVADTQTMWTDGAGDPIYLAYAATKMRQAEAALRDLLLPDGDRPWGLNPSPIPDLPDDVESSILQDAAAEARQQMEAMAQQGGQTMDTDQFRAMAMKLKEQMRDKTLEVERKEARERAERMEQAIEERMERGAYYHAMAEYVQHFCTYPTGILKGPFLKRSKRLKWPRKGGGAPVVSNAADLTWTAVNPFDCFPAPQAQTCQDGDFIERIRMTRADLYECIGTPGYNEAAIRNVLATQQNGGLRAWLWSDAERRMIEGMSHDIWIEDYLVDAIHFWGSVEGKTLIEYGITEGVEDQLAYYEVDAVLIGSDVIRCEINDDPLGRRPYFNASYDPVPGAFWGNSIFELMADCQGMINGAARALNANMGFACLTADTVVYRHPKAGKKKGENSPISNRKREDVEVTIGQLWETREGLGRQRIRCLNEKTGEFFGNKVVGIFDNGVQPVYRVKTENGYDIKATANHRFMCADGEYQTLDRFTVGDPIAVNGRAEPLLGTCMDCGASLKSPVAVRCRSCNGKTKYKPAFCLDCGKEMGESKSSGAKRCQPCYLKSEIAQRWNRKQAEEALTNRDASENTSRGRKLVRDQLANSCSLCQANEDLHLHHIDRDPLNCDPENTLTLCEPCHKWWHMRHDHMGDPCKHVWVDYDRIVSIEYVGQERVFDLSMKAPFHNFVANGFVSHNSGPMCGIDMAQLAAGQDPKAMRPLQIWQLDRSRAQAAAAPIEWYQAESNATELLGIINTFKAEADDLTGIPRYTEGSAQATGAAGTFGGLSMLMSQAAKGFRRAVAEIDRCVISKSVEATFTHEMLYNPDDTIKGDCTVEARGAAAVLIKEHLQQTRGQFLAATNNPIDMQIIGLSGRRAVLKESAKALDMPIDDVVGTDQEWRAKTEQSQQMPPQPRPDTVLKAKTDLQKAHIQSATKLATEGLIHPHAAAVAQQAALAPPGANDPGQQPGMEATQGG